MRSERRSYAERAAAYAETLSKRFQHGVLTSLQGKPLWSLWKAEPDEQGNIHKRPYSPRGYPLSTNKPEQWSSLATVLDAVASATFQVNGIGILLPAPYVLIDLDVKDNPLYDKETQTVSSSLALRLMREVPSYAELSPHHGLHILTQGKLQQGNFKTPELEMYTNWFATVTTRHVPGTPLDITNQQQAIAALENEFHPPTYESVFQNTGGVRQAGRLAALPPEAATDTLLQRLLAGDISGFASPSSADFVLIMKLLHWTGDDIALSKAIFLASSLGQRAKAREDTREGRRGGTTYLDATIDAVLKKRRNPPMKR